MKFEAFVFYREHKCAAARLCLAHKCAPLAKASANRCGFTSRSTEEVTDVEIDGFVRQSGQDLKHLRLQMRANLSAYERPARPACERYDPGVKGSGTVDRTAYMEKARYEQAVMHSSGRSRQ